VAFLIDNARIPFDQYKELLQWSEKFTEVESIVELLDFWYNPNADFLQVKTSGSTGLPKLISHSKKAIKASCLKTQNYFDLQMGQKALLCLPVRFVAGKLMVLRSVHSDLDLIVTNPSSRPLLDVDQHIDFAPMTPHQFGISLNQDKIKLNAIRKILLGGAPVPFHFNESIREMNNDIYLGYGMTETITHIAVKKLNGNHLSNAFKAIEGITFAQSDNKCLIIHADHLNGLVVTRDVVNLKSIVEFEWQGRLDNVINSGGVKIYPEVLESKIQNFIKTRFFISKLDDELLGDKTVLIIENQMISKDLLKSNLKLKLNKIEIPKQIYFLDEFIQTPTGKIDRHKTLKLALINNKTSY